jgi:hypothetical protein
MMSSFDQTSGGNDACIFVQWFPVSAVVLLVWCCVVVVVVVVVKQLKRGQLKIKEEQK